MASRPPRLRPALLALLLAPGLAPMRATAQEASQAMSQGMALTAPRVAGLSARSVPLPPPRPGEAAEAAPIAPAGRLPNQATGPRRDRVVRDICIGC